MPKGARLLITARYDNSSTNKFNPDPAAVLRWGDSTRDEMMSCVVYFYVDGDDVAKNDIEKSFGETATRE